MISICFQMIMFCDTIAENTKTEGNMKIEIYIKPGCPYCARALNLLGAKRQKVSFELVQYEASSNKSARATMTERSGRNTFPQVFLNGRHLGGCDDLHALDARGELDKMLGITR